VLLVRNSSRETEFSGRSTSEIQDYRSAVKKNRRQLDLAYKLDPAIFGDTQSMQALKTA
jgi:hypothetical protein